VRGALQWPITHGENLLAKPNYSYEKRQRELAKKKQQDAKEARKREEREAAKADAAAAPEDLPQE
jgi:hypothetical protein